MYPVLERLLVFGVAALIGAPIVFWAIHELERPLLFAEDVLETRECRDCSGTGTEHIDDVPYSDGRCVACAGAGEIQVIVPGPNRPTRLKGVVVDAATLGVLDDYRSLTTGRRGSIGHRPKGAVEGARITLTETAESAGSGEPQVIRIESNPFGRFVTLVPPGVYDVRVEKEGFRTLTSELEVEPLTGLIWLEKANIIRPMCSLAETRSRYGLVAVVALSRDDEGGVSVGLGGP